MPPSPDLWHCRGDGHDRGSIGTTLIGSVTTGTSVSGRIGMQVDDKARPGNSGGENVGTEITEGGVGGDWTDAYSTTEANRCGRAGADDGEAAPASSYNPRQ